MQEENHTKISRYQIKLNEEHKYILILPFFIFITLLIYNYIQFADSISKFGIDKSHNAGLSTGIGLSVTGIVFGKDITIKSISAECILGIALYLINKLME